MKQVQINAITMLMNYVETMKFFDEVSHSRNVALLNKKIKAILLRIEREERKKH